MMYVLLIMLLWLFDVVDVDVCVFIVCDRFARAFDVSGFFDERFVVAFIGNIVFMLVLFDLFVVVYLFFIFNGNDGVVMSVFG